MTNISKKQKVLIVDDAAINIKILTKTLSSDYEIYFATNGYKAIEIARSENRPDLILLDIQMPEINGYEVCINLKANKKTNSIPIIFITTKNEIIDETRGFELGAVDYITKPFNTSILKARVQTHLELKQHRDNLEKLIEERTNQLLHSDRLATLGTFSAGIAHEVNNPNTFIQGNVQVLQLYWKLARPIIEKHLDEDTTGQLTEMTCQIDDIFKSMLDGSTRISHIINNLKTYARQDDQVAKSDHSLKKIVDYAIGLTKNRFKQNITISTGISEELKLNCNQQKMEQVFVNLLNNAIDAIGEETGRITINANTDTNMLNIFVGDNGAGIEEKNNTKIFNPFFTTKDKANGTGLGLSIVSGIVREHEGEINVESTKNEGTVFKISLPLS